MKNSSICVSIGNKAYPEIIDELKRIAFAEIRIDLLELTPNELQSIFQSHKNLIATCRPAKYSEVERAEILMNALRWGAAFVDVEIETDAEWRQPIIELAHELQRKVVVSYHNFKATPNPEELNQIVESLYAAGADFAKIACMVQAPEDNARILGLYANFEKLIAIGMGSGGIITRVIAPLMGAPFTFASLEGTEIVPGQLDEKQLSVILNLLESYTSGRK